MKKRNSTLLMIVMGMFMISVFGINSMSVEAETSGIIPDSRSPFTTYFKEPIVIEKEVIVYVDREPEVIEEEPVAAAMEYNQVMLQDINGYYDVFQPTNLSYDDVITALGHRTGFYDFAEAFVDAEAIYGVNAIYLMATIGLESGWGKYRSGYNNLAGWKGGPGGTYSNFDSEYDCIMTVAEGLATRFLPDVGNTLQGVTGRYCPESDYMNKIMRIMNELQSSIL